MESVIRLLGLQMSANQDPDRSQVECYGRQLIWFGFENCSVISPAGLERRAQSRFHTIVFTPANTRQPNSFF